MTIHPTVRGILWAIALILGLVGIATVYYRKQVDELIALAFGAQDAGLTDAGFTAMRHAHSLAATVPGLKDQIAALKKVHATPIGSGRVTAGGVSFDVPLGQYVPPNCAQPGAPQPPTLSVTPEVDLQGVIAMDVAHNFLWAGKVFGTVKVGDWISEKKELRVLLAELTPSDELKKIIASGLKGPPKWEARIGIGVPGPTLRFGASWYPFQHVGVAGSLGVPIGYGGAVAADVGVAIRY